jgi:putative ABC transport system permease protein
MRKLSGFPALREDSLMTRFLLKGLLRDRHRSLFPVLIVAIGAMLTIVLACLLHGIVGDITRTNAKLDTGHVKVMTRAYAKIADQLPNDLAIAKVSQLVAELKQRYPELDWVPRIKFGGLLDIPDANGETRTQGPAFGIAIDLLSKNSTERERLNLEKVLIQGHLPHIAREILISEQLAQNLGVHIGESATLIGATANGSMAVQNFIVAGTIKFGVEAMDRNAILADLKDIQYALDMEDAAGEVLGFFPNMIYQDQIAKTIVAAFNAQFIAMKNDFTPIMLTLKEQNGLGEYLDTVDTWMFILLAIFVGTMSIVLWNTGLMSGIRRYGEIGVRLAIGESKGHVYWTLMYEAVLVGMIGSVLGTTIGLGISYYFQEVGLDFSAIFKGATMVISSIIRAQVTPDVFFIGFIPGLLATTVGAMMAGIGIFRRQTSQLFKELEA